MHRHHGTQPHAALSTLTMAGLLDLSSELLFEIVGFVITSPIAWPEGSTRCRPSLGQQNSYKRNIQCVPTPGLAVKHPATSLLFANRRLHSETQTYLARNPQTLTLDVAIVNDHWIWPTWRNLPLRMQVGAVDRIDIHITPCCTDSQRVLQTNWDGYSRLGEWRDDDDEWEPISKSFAWQLMNPLCNLVNDKHLDVAAVSTLDTFLQHLFPTQYERTSPRISGIEMLAFHINTRRYGNGTRLLDESEVPLRTVNGLAHLDFKRLYPCDLDKLRFYFQDMLEYFELWFRKCKLQPRGEASIGKALFYVDGEVVREMDPPKSTVNGVESLA